VSQAEKVRSPFLSLRQTFCRWQVGLQRTYAYDAIIAAASGAIAEVGVG